MSLVNGIESDTISAADRGLAFADGLFETVAVVETRILNWTYHLERLSQSCARLFLSPPDPHALESEVRHVASGHERCVVKIILTRGDGGRAYTPPAKQHPTRIISRRAWPTNCEKNRAGGVTIGVAEQRLGPNPALAGMKHLGRLEQVLASIELARLAHDDLLMLDLADRVIESTRCNVFAVSRETLQTPALNECGVRGVMRSIVFELAARRGIALSEQYLTVEDLLAADELFLCNAIVGIWPVRSLSANGVSDYILGPVTRELQNELLRAGHCM